jgi:hypothetical protein
MDNCKTFAKLMLLGEDLNKRRGLKELTKTKKGVVCAPNGGTLLLRSLKGNNKIEGESRLLWVLYYK